MVVFRKPGGFKNRKHYPQGGRKRRIGRGVRQISKLTQDVSALKQAVNVEYKYYDRANSAAPDPNLVPISTAALPNNALIMLENAIPQGVTSTTREGDIIRIKSYLHRCILRNEGTGPVRVRMILFLFMRPNQTGIAPAVSDLLEVEPSGNFNAMVAPRNLENRSRYKILVDNVYTLEPVGGVGEQKFINIFKKFDFHCQWPNTSTGKEGTTLTKNSLYCMYFSDGGNNAAQNTAKVYCFSRIRYIDN